MKKIILASLILGSTLTFAQGTEGKQRAEKDFKVSLGALAGYGSKLYKVDQGKGVLAPILKLEYKGFYLSGSEIGYTQKVNGQLSLVTFVQGFGGLTLLGAGSSFDGKVLDNSDMKTGYKEIDDRKTQIEAGINFKYKTGIERIELVGGLRGGERGGTASLGVIQPYMFGPKWYVFPNAGVSIMNANMINYYFGVDKKEVNKDTNDKLTKVYKPNKFGFATTAGVTSTYILTSNWSLFGNFQAQYLGDTISDSPIVKNNVNFFLGAGVNYTF